MGAALDQARAKKAAKSSKETLDERAARLERLREAAGAPEPESDSPGLFRKVADILSRPNYAMAGAAEELFSPEGEKTDEGAAGRAFREFFSGIGGLQGDKRGFPEVMERGGVPTGPSLSELFPSLYSDTGEGARLQRGGILDVTARGAVGTLADIFGDPSTYLTGGSGAAAKVVGKGTTYLSKGGKAAWLAKQAQYAPEFSKIEALATPMEKHLAGATLRRKMAEEFEEEIAKRPGMIDPGGLKWMGQTVVSRKAIQSVTQPVREALAKVPGADRAYKAAETVGEGTRFVFDRFARLSKLPAGVRESAKRMSRDAASISAVSSAKWFERWEPLRAEWRKAIKSDPALNDKFIALREQTGTPVLTPKQQTLYQSWSEIYDEISGVLERTGVLEPEEIAKYGNRYMFHLWKNSRDLSEMTRRLPTTAKFTRERQYQTFADGIETSKALNEGSLAARAAGQATGLYPILEPADVFDGLAAHIQQAGEMLGRQWFHDESARVFGRAVDDIAPDSIYDIVRPASKIPRKDAWVIERFFDAHPTLRAAASAAGSKGGKVVRQDEINAGFARIAKAAQRALPHLSEDGRHEFFRRMFASTRSVSQLADVTRAFGSKWERYFPRPVAVRSGEIMPGTEWLGAEAALQKVGGGMWGERELFLPQAIVREVENLGARILDSREWAPGAQKMLRGWDDLNNWFKTSVYSLWIPSAVRDLYNNVAMSMLDIGVGALGRPLATAKVLANKNPDEIVKLGGQEFKVGVLRRWAEEMNVLDTRARAYRELTGEYRGPGALGKVARFRGSVDNGSRVQLWLNNINRGLDPRDAAEHVQRFLFDYGELSDVEKGLFRRAIPFYTFPRKAIQLHAELLLEKPGALAAQIKPFRGREDENGAMVKWEAEGLKLRLDRDGRTVRALTGIDLPIRTLDTLWTGSLAGTGRRQLGMLTPFIKTPIETGMQRDTFTGRPFGARQAPLAGRVLEAVPTPKPLLQWLGYNKEFDKAGRPVYTMDQARFGALVNLTLMSRVVSMGDRQFREYFEGEPALAASALDMLTGVRFKEINLDEQQKRKTQERVRQLEEILVRWGKMRTFSKAYEPKKVAR